MLILSPKILTSTLSYEVLIIDDASEDHTTDFIKSYEPTYRVFLMKEIRLCQK